MKIFIIKMSFNTTISNLYKIKVKKIGSKYHNLLLAILGNYFDI